MIIGNKHTLLSRGCPKSRRVSPFPSRNPSPWPWSLWIRHLLQELGLPCTEPIHIYYDNMQNIQDASHHPCTKHFRVEGHWVRELVDHGDAEMTYARSAENITDILTKSLPLAQHKFLVHKLGMLWFSPPVYTIFLWFISPGGSVELSSSCGHLWFPHFKLPLNPLASLCIILRPRESRIYSLILLPSTPISRCRVVFLLFSLYIERASSIVTRKFICNYSFVCNESGHTLSTAFFQ